MRLDEHALTDCLDKVKEVLEIYTLNHLGTDDPKRYAEYLHRICEKILGKTITVHRLEIPGGISVKGIMVLLEDKYEIIVSRDLNECWARFVFCKELFHALLDQEKLRNMDLEEHIESCVVEFPIVEHKTPPPSEAVQIEALAEIAAMEFLFPYEARAKELVGPFKDDSLAIAQKYKIPRLFVEEYMSHGFMDLLKQFN